MIDDKWASLSEDRLYRLALGRGRRGGGLNVRRLGIIGVNPSTADAETNDHTIVKEIGFCDRLGFHTLLKGNLFAYRATDVRELAKVEDPVGPENDEHLFALIVAADVLVYAWGPLAKLPGRLRGRWAEVHKVVQQVRKDPPMCWGYCQDGHPRHPLMLAYNSVLEPWYEPSVRALA